MAKRVQPGFDGEGTDSELTLIDADVHQRWADESEVVQYLPERYRDDGLVLPTLLYRNPGGYFRDDEFTDDGGTPGSDLEKIVDDHLDRYGIDYAMFTGNSWLNLGAVPNRDYAGAVAEAYNRWLIEECLSVDERFLGSIFVPVRDPERGAELICEYGEHPQVRQVMLPGGSEVPYGRPQYWPMYEAAQEQNLAIAVHPFSEGHGVSNPPTGAGHPNNYIEWHTLLGTVFMGQLASMITEGVFVEYPELRVAFIEGGYGWVPHFMWRMDKNWKGLRSQVPWLEKPPSEYIREQVWFASQPVEEPERPEHHSHLMEMMHAEETLVFASDYPHWDGDSPVWGLPPMEDDLERAVRYGNAKRLWGLPADPGDLA